MSDLNSIPLRYRAAAVFSIFAIGYAIGSSHLPGLIYSASRAAVEKANLEYDMAAAQRAVAKRFDVAMEAEKRMLPPLPVLRNDQPPAAAAPAPSPLQIPLAPALQPQTQILPPAMPAAPQPLPAPTAALQAPAQPRNEAIAPSSIDQLLEVGRFGSRFADPAEFGLK